jgi:hypothetical protein
MLMSLTAQSEVQILMLMSLTAQSEVQILMLMSLTAQRGTNFNADVTYSTE